MSKSDIIETGLKFNPVSGIWSTELLTYDPHNNSVHCRGRRIHTDMSLEDFIKYSVEIKVGVALVETSFIPVLYTYHSEDEYDCVSLLNSERFTIKKEDIL